MPTEYTLQDLAALAGVTPRTIRYYISQGLLPSPSQTGPAARYTEAHLERLRLIRKLQGAHLPLAEIRAQLRLVGDRDIAMMVEPSRTEPPMDSAADYIRDVLAGGRQARASHALALPGPALPARPAPAVAPPTRAVAPPTRAVAPPTQPEPPRTAEPERAQWERIALGPDIELHIRRPLSRQLNKRVERLILIARQLLEED